MSSIIILIILKILFLQAGTKSTVPFATNRSTGGLQKRTLGAIQQTQPATARLQATGGDQFGRYVNRRNSVIGKCSIFRNGSPNN